MRENTYLVNVPLRAVSLVKVLLTKVLYLLTDLVVRVTPELILVKVAPAAFKHPKLVRANTYL